MFILRVVPILVPCQLARKTAVWKGERIMTGETEVLVSGKSFINRPEMYLPCGNASVARWAKGKIWASEKVGVLAKEKKV